MNLTIAVAIILTVAVTETVFGCQIDMNAYRQGALNEHNKLRAKHGTPPLILDNDLNNGAQRNAYVMSQKGENMPEDQGWRMFEHHGMKNNTPGENFHYSCGYQPKANEFVEKMYNHEGSLWVYGNENPNGEESHFTQIVWKNLCKMGVGLKFYKGCKCHAVAYYFTGPERANVAGRYTENVPRVGSASSSANCAGGNTANDAYSNTNNGGSNNAADNGYANTNNGGSNNAANNAYANTYKGGSKYPAKADMQACVSVAVTLDAAGLKSWCNHLNNDHKCPQSCAGVPKTN